MGNKQSSPPVPATPPAPPPAEPTGGGFAKGPRPDLSLQIGRGKSSPCDSCAIVVDPTLSSSTVALSRDILGKTMANPLPYPPSNLPDLDSRPTGDGGMYSVPEPNSVPSGSSDKVTTLSWKAGTLLSDHSTHWEDHTSQWDDEYNGQKAEEEKNKKKWDQKNRQRTGVRIWNPSDDPTQPTLSIAVNYREYGALTKLFIKPTIPFPVSFSLTGPRAPAPPSQPASAQQVATQRQLESNKEARQSGLAGRR